MLVPQVDADGNDLGGVRSLHRAGAARHLHGLESRPQGSLRGRLLLAAGKLHPVRADARRSGCDAKDPRPSIEERYPTKEAYVAKVKQEAAAWWRSACCCRRIPRG